MIDKKTLSECDGDAAILALFREWRQMMRRLQEMGTDDPQGEAALDRTDELKRQIFDLPVSGAAGLAIKGYPVALFLRFEKRSREGALESLGNITPEDFTAGGRLCFDTHAVKSFAEAAVGFVPELAPLVAEVVEVPMLKSPLFPLPRPTRSWTEPRRPSQPQANRAQYGNCVPKSAEGARHFSKTPNSG